MHQFTYKSACTNFKTFMTHSSSSLPFVWIWISLEPSNDDLGAAEHEQEHYLDQPGKHVRLLIIFH